MKATATLCSLCITVMAASTVEADILLGAPTQAVPLGTRIATAVPFKVNYSLTDSYKFVFTGIQAKGDTLGAPGASGTSGNGGQFHLKGTVSTSSNSSARAGLIEFRNVQDFNSSPLKTLLISPAVVFKATNTPITINLEWSGQGNAHKPNGTFNILGEYQKNPPAPTGSLNFASGQWAIQGIATPNATVSITRE